METTQPHRRRPGSPGGQPPPGERCQDSGWQGPVADRDHAELQDPVLAAAGQPLDGLRPGEKPLSDRRLAAGRSDGLQRHRLQPEQDGTHGWSPGQAAEHGWMPTPAHAGGRQARRTCRGTTTTRLGPAITPPAAPATTSPKSVRFASRQRGGSAATAAALQGEFSGLLQFESLDPDTCQQPGVVPPRSSQRAR